MERVERRPGKLTVGATDGTSVDWPASCGTSSTTVTYTPYAPAAVAAAVAVAVCRIASNWAAVYPAASAADAPAACKSHGHSVWDGRCRARARRRPVP